MPKIATFIVFASLACTCRAQQSPVVPPIVLPVTTSPAPLNLTAFESKALLALSAGGTIPNMILSGTVDRVAGSFKESGTVKLTSGTAGLETEDWSLSSGERVLSKSAFTDTRTCSVEIGGKDLSQKVNLDCQRVVPWFAPWAALVALNAQFASATVTTSSSDTAAGSVRLSFVPAFGDLTTLSTTALKAVADQMKASAVDVVFDALTNLPKRVEYLEQTNGDPAAAIATAVDLSDFSLEGGLMVPHHIQRYVQRTLESDIHITSVVTQ